TSKAATLAKGMLEAMFLTKIKAVTLFFMSVAVLGVSASLVAQRLRALGDSPSPIDNQPPTEKEATLSPESRRPSLDADGNPLPPGAVTRLGRINLRHGGGVMKIAYSPDGQLLASIGGMREPVRLWDTSTGRLVRELRGHVYSSFGSIAFS